MMNKISGLSIMCLKEAIVAIFWYKKDLTDFLGFALVHREFLLGIDSSSCSKIEIVDKVFENINRVEEAIRTSEYLNLYRGIKGIKDF